MNSFKKLMALALSILMVVSCVPNMVFVWAADETTTTETVTDTATDPYAYQNVVKTAMFTTANSYTAAVAVNSSFGVDFEIAVDRRLKSVTIPLYTMANNTNKIKVELFTGTWDTGGTELYEWNFENHTDGADLVCEIPQNYSFEGKLWVCVTPLSGSGVSPKGADASANGALCTWQGTHNAFQLWIEDADIPVDRYKYAELDLSTHTDNPPVTFGIKTLNSINAVFPSQYGYLSLSTVDADPYLTITEASVSPLLQSLASVPASKVDYVVIKYRTENVANGQLMVARSDNKNFGSLVADVEFETSGEWETVIVDASKIWGDTNSAYLTAFRMDIGDGAGGLIDIAYVRFYSSLEGAEACVEAEATNYVALPITIRDFAVDGMLFEYSTIFSDSIVNGFKAGNNYGYGLLRTNSSTVGSDVFTTESMPGTLYNTTTQTAIELSNGMVQHSNAALFRTDLVEGTLGANGKPVYTQATVEWLAAYVQYTLQLPAYTGSAYNLFYVSGYQHEALDGKDLATAIREQITDVSVVGDYNATVAKAEALTGENALASVETYMDAAYFLLHNTFVDQPGYGMTVSEYKTMNLLAQTNDDGTVTYVFNAGYDGTHYDLKGGSIQNGQTSVVTPRYKTSYDASSGIMTSQGLVQPENLFDPLIGLGYGEEASNFRFIDIMNANEAWADENELSYYENTNFLLTMEGHAKFVYHYADDLYFAFTGDDDVYLYINGQRVMDLGGAHSISRVQVNINEVAEQLGLKEGEIYDFDFFYMERHGSGANLGIETNIKVVDPAILAEKEAYQNGIEVEHGGYVDGNQPVDYAFSVRNDGEVPFRNITFRDDAIGAVLTPDADTAFVLPTGVAVTDLRLTKYNDDGTVAVSQKGLTEAEIKEYLAAGLDAGERLTIYGFSHQIAADQWHDNDEKGLTFFENYLYVTATIPEEFEELVSSENLSGTDSHHVHKAEYTFTGIHRYDWGRLDTEKADGSFVDESIGLTIPKSEILETIRTQLADAGVENSDLDNGVLTITASSGLTEGGAITINQHASIVNGDVFFRTTKAGMETFYVTLTVNGQAYNPLRVDVYTYGIADNVLVIDYNLPVELNENNLLLNNDVVWLADNTFDMLDPYILIGDGAAEVDGTYGKFASNSSSSVVYTMNKFMNGVDTITVEIKLFEMGMMQENNYTGVTMTQTIKVVPANVMYYEDDFEALNYNVTYVKNDFTDGVGNVWAKYESDLKGDRQSADQDMNYGFDPNYATATGGVLTFDPTYIEDADVSASVLAALDLSFNGTVEAWEKYYPDLDYPTGAMPGDASNDTIHVMNITHPTNSEIFSFEFVGTGFEILSRTTMDYAVLTVKVEQLQEDGTYKTYKVIPVISESYGGDLSQIPLIARKDMPYGQYKVTVNTSNVRGENRLVFIDGVRIYQPLTEEEGATYYKDAEAQVKFHEIKTSIKGQSIVYGTIAEDEVTGEYENLWAYGDSMVEDRFGDFVLCATGVNPDPNDNYLGSYDEYMKYGPNNEIYLSAADYMPLAYIAFYVTEDENYVGERSIQVGAHHKYTPDNEYRADEDYDLSAVALVYGGNASHITDVNSTYVHTVASGTEQYFSIDVSCLEFKDDPNNADAPQKALLIIGTNDPNQNVLALTNLKLNGYSIADGSGYEVSAAQDTYDVLVSELTAQTYELTKQYAVAASERS